MGRCPLRQSHRLALGEALGTNTLRRLAREIGVASEELDQVIAGTIAPTLGDRAKIVQFLVRKQLAGRWVHDLSDPHGPGKEGLEDIGTAKDQRRYRTTMAPRDNGRDF